MEMGMMGLRGFREDGNGYHGTPLGDRNKCCGTPWGCRRNAETEMHFTITLILLCLQRQKEYVYFFNLIPVRL